ncbi:hypothetical protein D3C87_772940 [compost metagenome]
MTRPITTASPSPRTRASSSASPVEEAKPQAAPAVVTSTDRLELGGGTRDRLLEADLRLKVTPSARLVANGQIGFSRTFIERLLNHALGKGKTVTNAQVSFDPTKRAYSVRATAHVLGMSLPFTVDLKPQVIGQGVGFKLENLRMPLGDSERFGLQHRWITSKVCDELAESLKWSLGARAHPDQGVVTLNPNSILHHVQALPESLELDLAQIQMQTSVSASGDLSLGMHAEGMAAAVNSSPQSDLTLEADAAGLQGALKRLLAPDYEVGTVTLRDGGAVIGGKAEFKDGSDVINAGKLLIALIGVANGEARAANLINDPSRLMIPLDLDLSLDGSVLRVKPSIGKAMAELEKTFTSAGLNPVQEGDRLRVDLSDLLQNRGEFDALKFRKDGLQVQMKLDLDAFIRNPAISGRTE